MVGGPTMDISPIKLSISAPIHSLSHTSIKTFSPPTTFHQHWQIFMFSGNKSPNSGNLSTGRWFGPWKMYLLKDKTRFQGTISAKETRVKKELINPKDFATTV